MTCEYYDPASLAMELHAMTMYPVDNFKMLRAGLLHLVAEYQLFWSLSGSYRHQFKWPQVRCSTSRTSSPVRHSRAPTRSSTATGRGLS